MDEASETLLALKTVTFRYKKDIDPQGKSQFGLYGGGSREVSPQMVVRDEGGQTQHRALRTDQRHAAQRVPQGAQKLLEATLAQWTPFWRSRRPKFKK